MTVILRVLRALGAAFSDVRVLSVLGFTFVIILGASVVYRYVEGWGWLNSIYFSVMTISTVGYGDFSPETVAGKIFTIAYVIAGLGVFVAMATAVAEAILRQRDDDRGGN